MTKAKHYGVLAGAVAVALATDAASAAPFTAGSLVVFQAGTGAAALTSAATADLLDEYTVGGTQLQQITLPTTSSGTATSEGLLTTGPTGLLAVEGYNVAVGTTGVTGTVPSATANQRVVNVVDATGAINSATSLSNAFSGNNIRGAVTDGTNVFASGTSASGSTATAGIQAAPIGGTTATQVESTVTNTRAVNLFGGNLFFSTGSGTAGIYQLAGTPTVAGSTPTLIATDSLTGASPYAFYFASLTGVGAPAGLNTLYVADSGTTPGTTTAGTAGTILKYSLGATGYTLTGSVTVPGAVTGGSSAATNITGLTGVTPAAAGASAGAVADLYLASPTNLYAYVDAAGYGVAPTAVAPTSIATAATNTAFRGIAFSPTATVAVPEPTALGLAAAGAAGLLARRRRTA